MPVFLTNSQTPLLIDNNNNITNTMICKSWIKPITLFSFSSMVSIITSPITAVTNYWRKSVNFGFSNGWNSFIMSPTAFISSELINSFFYTWSFFKIEFFLDTLFNNSLSKSQKLKNGSKDMMLVLLLLFINEISKNIIDNQLNDQAAWNALAKDFFFSLGKETVIVIAWKVFKNCLTNNRHFNDYFNATLIMTMLGIAYLNANVGQTLYNIWNMPISQFVPNFAVTLTSNTIVGALRIVSSSLLTCFFDDIITKWKNGLCKKPLVDESDDLLEEVITGSVNRSYHTFAVSTSINNWQSKRSISYDSFFNVEEINQSDKQIAVVNNVEKANAMIL